MPFLEARHVHKRYANHVALDDVSISVEQGKVFGLLGPNGAGKTSLIRIINRITAPDKGEVLIEGKPLAAKDVSRIGYLPEERGLYRKMKVGEQAIYLARLKGIDTATATARLREWFDKFDIMPWWNKKVEELSKGMQQKIQFVSTVIHEPELLIFDEPFSGFDPVNADLLKAEILNLRDKGRTVIFSTHNMQSVEEVCDDIALVNSAHIVLNGSVEEIKRQHSEGLLKIVLESSDTLPQSYLDSLSVLEYKTRGGRHTIRFRRPTGVHNQEVIAGIPSSCNLLLFEEELPSMHDIFVKTVKNNTHEQQ
ncbi:Lipopolysaccharide export system ATP-binding protein LptB [Porphyromonas crevioricanis]|uniref:Lipopolysaccharide export system ATP-binding protein LptB n=1 Tax=Porphyromonas crevioricanis TaxID=393921 RepID=A0A2X4PGE3_9PORP|nr:ABC transporter ATP-binding protein [Porphyromonas crevioricanis]GAD07369.1 ABC transporter, ATP-binding protein [Porphyromonas crevioricanis JCM 13913]SQH72934.1 Lipopolysaccharide export system ATP-binding protein LptB [Porphyromonas crevioricanis]